MSGCFVNGCKRPVVTTSSWLAGPTLSACRVHDAALRAMTRRQAELQQAQGVLL